MRVYLYGACKFTYFNYNRLGETFQRYPLKTSSTYFRLHQKPITGMPEIRCKLLKFVSGCVRLLITIIYLRMVFANNVLKK